MRAKLICVALILFISLGFWYGSAKADVAGSFGVRLLLTAVPCQLLDDLGIVGMPDQPCEKTFFKADFESDLSTNVTISGLTLGLHSHAGVTGFEDIILTLDTTLGALDIMDTLVFAQPYGIVQSPDGDVIPTCYEDAPGSGVCLTLFVKKRVNASISLGGITLRNLTIIEDVNFPLPSLVKPIGSIYAQQSQSFGFGNLITVFGQTLSGLTITGQLGLCVSETQSNLIKKHSFSFIVNPDCTGNGTTVNPAVFFDFEKFTLSNITIVPNLMSDITLGCVENLACTFTNAFALSGAPIFSLINANYSFGNVLGPFSFSDVTLQMHGSVITLTMIFNPASAAVTSVSASGTFTLNPDTNPASLSVSASGSPGTGLSSLVANLSVNRSGMTAFALATFGGSSGTLNFSLLTLRVTAEVSLFSLEASAAFKLSGFGGAGVKGSVSF